MIEFWKVTDMCECMFPKKDARKVWMKEEDICNSSCLKVCAYFDCNCENLNHYKTSGFNCEDTIFNSTGVCTLTGHLCICLLNVKGTE